MQLQSVSILMGAVTESSSLEKTIEDILALPKELLIEEVLIAYPENRVTPACRQSLKKIDNEAFNADVSIKVIAQKTPRWGFFTDLIEIANSTHCLFFPSDCPKMVSLIKPMVEMEKDNPECIVSSSRWMKGGSFGDYNKIKLILNKFGQIYLRILFHTKLTDLTNCFQIAPTQLMKSIHWEETGFSRGMEMVLKPLMLGVQFIEFPIQYKEREEGKSGNSFLEIFDYLIVSLKIKRLSKERILKRPYNKSLE